MYSPFRYSFTNPVDEDYSAYPYKNIDFNGKDNDFHGQNNPPAPPKPRQTIQDFYNQVSNQSMPAQTAYMNYLKQGYPNEANYKPSKLTRLSAVLAGASTGFVRPGQGAEAAESILNRPYERAVRQYGIEGQKLRESAGIEQSDLSNRAKLAKDFQDAQDKQDELELKVNADKRAEKNVNSQISSRQLVDQKTIMQLAGEGKELHIGEDGNAYIYNKANGTLTKAGKTGESPIEKENRAVSTATKTAEATEPSKRRILQYGFDNSRAMQGSLFAHEDKSQDKSFEHSDSQLKTREAEANKRNALTHSTQSQTNLNKRNVDAVVARIQTDPNKYKGLYFTPDEAKSNNQLPFELKNPGMNDKENPTPEEVMQWNAFVELFNLRNAGNTQVQQLTPIRVR